MRAYVPTISHALPGAGTGSLCGFLLALTISATAALTASPELTIDQGHVGQEGDVSFSVLALGADPRSDFPEPRFQPAQTDDQRFRLYQDTDSIQQVRFNTFNFTVYLANAATGERGAFKYQVNGIPSGSFRDGTVRVTFHVKNGAYASAGGITMPVYNATRTDLLVVEKQTEPAKVSVSGSTLLQIRVANPADGLQIAITDVVVTESCPQCWTRITSAINEKSAVLVDPGTATNLAIDLAPNSIPALLQGAQVVRPGVAHDTLSLTVTYHSVPGGADRKQTILADIRFGPGIFGLALSLCGGLALGLIGKYLLTGKFGEEGEKPVHAILTAFVFGLIVEFVGVTLTAYGSSKLVLFGMDIDPRQLLPAFILALFVGGGTAVASRLKDFLKGRLLGSRT